MRKEELIAVREEKELLNIAINKQQNPNAEIENDLKKHLQKYCWIPTDDPTGSPWTEQDLMVRIDWLLKQNPKEKLNEIILGEERRKKQLDEFISELELEQRTIKLIEIARDFVYLRNYRVEAWVQSLFAVKPFFEFIARKAGLTFDELMALSSEEIKGYLESGKLISREEIEKRLKEYE